MGNQSTNLNKSTPSKDQQNLDRKSLNEGPLKNKVPVIPPQQPVSPSEADVIKHSSQSLNKLERILGCLFGQALGDAVGLATEFVPHDQIEPILKMKPPIVDFPCPVKTFHSSAWIDGDWTDDTDQMLCILFTYLESTDVLQPDYKIFAHKLRDWIEFGFPILGDEDGAGIGRTVMRVTTSEGFLEDPHAVAEKVNNDFAGRAAANGAVMRTSITGVVGSHDLETVIRNTINFAKVTHADSRCIGSSVLVASLIAQLVECDETPISERNSCRIQETEEMNHNEKENPTNDVNQCKNLQNLIDHSKNLALQYIDVKYHDEFESMHSKNLTELELDHQPSIGYTFKCSASALYALKNYNRNFKEILSSLAYCGGDTDTNMAVAGALIGASVGLRELPLDWLLKMPYRKFYGEKIVELLNRLGYDSEVVVQRLKDSNLL